MGTFIYRRLPYPDIAFRLEDGRTIFQVTFQYENREGRRPRWTNTGAITLGKFPSIDGCHKIVAAKPGEIFTADFFRDDGRTETERHEYLNQLLEVGKIAAVGHVEGCAPKMTPEYDDAFYRVYEYAADYVNDSRNHDTAAKADEKLDLFMVCPKESFYTGSRIVEHPALLPLSVFGRDWGAGSLDEHRKEAKAAAKETEKMGKIKKVGTCSGGGRLNHLSGKIEPYCIEFTDPEAKAIFMKIAMDRYFDWLEKQQNRR
ncbi:MAG TPA: hypothetical protein PLV73_11145 [Treponemataceae bacterium]|nr:hypothetical protein [Treponemataceae bacterium]